MSCLYLNMFNYIVTWDCCGALSILNYFCGCKSNSTFTNVHLFVCQSVSHHVHGVCNQSTEEGVGEASVLGPLLFFICMEFTINGLKKECQRDQYMACSSSCVEFAINGLKKEWEKDQYLVPCSSSCVEFAINGLKKEWEKDRCLAPSSSS